MWALHGMTMVLAHTTMQSTYDYAFDWMAGAAGWTVIDEGDGGAEGGVSA
jgi:hypothetical protein